MEDLLENVAIKPGDISFAGVSTIEVQNRPSVPDNVHSWQVFEDEKDILNFLLNEDKYHGQELDCSAWVETVDGKETIFGQEILQLKNNKVPKGLVVLESAFDNQDRIISNAKGDKPQELEEINLGTTDSPKKVYIGKNLNPDIRRSLINLLRRFRHVFAWSYDDLKAYRQYFFQHFIPLKEDVRPFR